MPFEPHEAEDLKHVLSDGELSQRELMYVQKCLEPARQRWYDTVMGLLIGLSSGKPLPWRVYLTGGGSLLPDLDKSLRADPAPFNRAPEVARLARRIPLVVKDLTDGLDQELFLVALSLAVGLPD